MACCLRIITLRYINYKTIPQPSTTMCGTVFCASSQDQEIKSPDLEVNVLESMDDVTARVNAAVKSDMSESAAFDARQAEIANIERESEDQTHLKSEVVTLYEGGEYWIYRYKKYTDVRLVFAPGLQTAFFGGDSDNFTFPRYCLDIAVFRVYENGKPLDTPNHLNWNIHGPLVDELAFVAGHPASTRRSNTMSQLLSERDLTDPIQVERLADSLATLQNYAARGPDQSRDVASRIYNLQNFIKSLTGKYKGLHDPELMAKKQAEEGDFRARIEADSQCKRDYQQAWKELDQTLQAPSDHGRGFAYRNAGTQLYMRASQIQRYVTEIKKPDGERLPGFHEAELASLRFRLLSPAPIHTELEIATMAGALTLAQKRLPVNDPWLTIVLDGKSPSVVATDCVQNTKLADFDYCRKFMDGGTNAVNASTDPMIVLAVKLNSFERSEQRWFETKIESQLDHATQQLAKARFTLYGKSTYPNATFTLRLSYGTVCGYSMNGTVAPWKTTMLGLYARASEFDEAGAFSIPAKWKTARDKLDLNTPLNFVADTDITGGNSGSPVVNRAGELVGLVFDGNIESLPGEFEYESRCSRTIAVHSAAMIESLKKIYGAENLVGELLSKLSG